MNRRKWRILSKLTGSGYQIRKYAGRYKRLFFLNFLWLLVALLNPYIQTDNVTNMRYLLSATAQALATVFALIATIPMVLIQLFPSSSKRKQLLKLELRPLQISFYLFFVVSIILPLYLLATNNFCSLWVRLCVGFTAMCLYNTVESTLAFKEKLERFTQ